MQDTILHELHENIDGIFRCWGAMSLEISKNDLLHKNYIKTFEDKIDSYKMLIHSHPTWNTFAQCSNISKENISNENYLKWFLTLHLFNRNIK